MGKLLLVAFLLIHFYSAAQNTVEGKVSSPSTPEGLPGVNVVIKGTSAGAITNLQGEYTLEVSPGAVLVFSFVGYQTQEISYADQSIIDVVLKEESQELNEIVVMGYSSSEKRDITGSIKSVNSSAFQDIALSSVDQALQGQAAGVQVVQSSGTPGGGISVRIRGSTSINASNRPLFIVDNIPVETGTLSLRDFGGQDDNALSLINPADIESITILKDASAKAIYGSRAANGVVIIKTKRGRSDITRITVDVQRGLIDPVKRLELLNATQLLELQREAVRNAGDNPDALGLIPGVTDAVNTNWQDEVLRTGILQQYQLSAAGGDDNTSFYLSLNYRDEEGVQLNNRFQRFSTTFNVDRKFSPKLTVNTSILLARTLNQRVKGDNFLDGVYSAAIKSLPYSVPYDENGFIVGPSSPLYAGFPNFNPVGQALLPRFDAITFKLLGSISASYAFNDHFILKGTAGVDYNDVTEDQYESSQTAIGGFLPAVGGQGYGVFIASTASTLTGNLVLTYQQDVKGHKISALVGTETIYRPQRNGNVTGRLFPSDDFTYITSAGVVDNGSSSFLESGLQSFFGEVKYDYKSKYLITAGMRADGSSRFGPGNRFAYFPSVSGAWVLSEEDFFNLDAFSDVKLRASYGFTGNERIPDYSFLGTWQSTVYNGNPGVVPANVENNNLKWETTNEVNVGFDISVWAGRLQATADVYYKKTTDLLYNRTVPTTSGFASVFSNIGDMENKGVELGLISVNLDKAIRWTTELNISKNVNKILFLADSSSTAGYSAENVTSTNIIQEGQSLGAFFGLRFLGVDPATGDAIYNDLNGDGAITTDDATVIGNPNPDWFGGITNRLTYKNFDLSIFFQFSLGNDVLNLTKATTLNAGQEITSNQSVDALRRWREPGDITDVPRYSLGAKENFNNYHSNRLIEDGSYLRLKNVGLGYTLPGRWANRVKLNKVRIYFSGTNLWTLTKYSGSDPEVSTLDGSTTAQGIDFFTLPQVRTMTIGINATLR